MLHQQQTINCAGKLLDLSKPIAMGILNLTPDSFYDGGAYQNDQAILQKVAQMLEDGAAIIDLGGMSSRPGAAVITPEEEIKRVVPVVQLLRKTFPDILLSIDTVYAAVAKAGVEEGAAMINDISAGSIDPDLWPTVAQLKVPYVLMHMQGRPNTMQTSPQYADVTQEVIDFLIQKSAILRKHGIKDIILDPGFGFGKTVDHNYSLLKQLEVFNILDLPVLVGLSRKSMIYKVLNCTPQQALNGTTALHMFALQKGAKILRAHDVKEATETIALWEKLKH